MSTTVEDVTTEQALAHVEREARRFVEVARRSPFAAHVPAYRDFTVGSLSAHIGRAFRLFEVLVTAGSVPEGDPIVAPEGPLVIDWLEEGVAPALKALRETPDDKLVLFPHGRGEQRAGSLAPGLAVEVGVHRWDLESVLGDHAPIPAELAVAEVDRALGFYGALLASESIAPIGGVIEFRATDLDLSWQASVTDGRLEAARAESGASAADVVVSASAEDLALVIWKRWLPPRAGVEVTGPISVLKRFLVTDYIPDPQTTPAH